MGHIFERISRYDVLENMKICNLASEAKAISWIWHFFQVQIVSLVQLHKLEIVNLCCTIWKANDSMWFCICCSERRLMCRSCFHQSKWQNFCWLRWEIRTDSLAWFSLKEWWSDVFFSILYLLVSQPDYCNLSFFCYTSAWLLLLTTFITFWPVLCIMLLTKWVLRFFYPKV